MGNAFKGAETGNAQKERQPYFYFATILAARASKTMSRNLFLWKNDLKLQCPTEFIQNATLCGLQ